MHRTMLFFSSALLVPVLCLLLAPSVSIAADLLSEDEMDTVAASGLEFTAGFDSNGNPLLNLGFQLGGTTGSGTVTVTPSPGTSFINGNLNISKSIFNVESMIFNMNLCVQCKATTLTQTNLGLPVNIKIAP